jgi:hypothetical protein
MRPSSKSRRLLLAGELRPQSRSEPPTGSDEKTKRMLRRLDQRLLAVASQLNRIATPEASLRSDLIAISSEQVIGMASES